MKSDLLHVGLNAHLLSSQPGYRSAGIHTYILQLIRHLLADPASVGALRYTIFTGKDRLAAHQLPPQQAHSTRWPTQWPLARIAWEQLLQPWVLLRTEVDLLHAMAFALPLVLSRPAVVTVHDLSFVHFPHRFQPAKRLYLKTISRISCRRARRVIAVSQATADDVTRLLGVPPERIDVIPHGVDHQRFRPLPPEQVQAFRQAQGLPPRFILFVGTLEPRKNLPRLIEAFARVRAQDTQTKLVIAGGQGWYFKEIFERVQALNLAQAVLFPGFVPPEALALWYNSAVIFVYPSTYEGFGLPLLEAMACGTPVVAANASCLPEVVGNAGLLASPDDPADLAQALLSLLNDPQRRADLAARGQARAQTYTWQATATATALSYRRAAGMGARDAGS